jgi:predicted site-specific integrase-resolvase
VILPTKRKSAMPDCPQITKKKKSQVGILDRFYPGTAIIKDIGNGLNFKRKNLFLLDRVYSGKVKKKIIVLYKERL